jgi:predicted nucleic acid-binding protein
MQSLKTDVMIDSSIWIEYFREKSKIVTEVNTLIGENRVVLCSEVEKEIIQGIRFTKGLQTEELRKVADIFIKLPFLDIWEEDCEAASYRMKRLRSRGVTIPVSDCVIGVICSRHNLSLLTLDKHFDFLQEVEKLK